MVVVVWVLDPAHSEELIVTGDAAEPRRAVTSGWVGKRRLIPGLDCLEEGVGLEAIPIAPRGVESVATGAAAAVSVDM